MAVPLLILENLLRDKFPCAHITLDDYANDQNHYNLIIIDQQFENHSLIKRHQMIYQALGSIVGQDLHAISLKALTPFESNQSHQNAT